MPEALNLTTATPPPARHNDAWRHRDPVGLPTSEFSSVLGRIQPLPGETADQTARKGAEQFVAIALVQPVLKSLRDNNHASAPFAPTQGEKQFQSLLDADLAQRIVRTRHFPLVDRLASDLLSAASHRKSPPLPDSV